MTVTQVMLCDVVVCNLLRCPMGLGVLKESSRRDSEMAGGQEMKLVEKRPSISFGEEEGCFPGPGGGWCPHTIGLEPRLIPKGLVPKSSPLV